MQETYSEVPSPGSPYNDGFAYLAAVVHGDIKLKPTDLSSLENNMVVVEILEAARKSAKEGKVVYLKKWTKYLSKFRVACTLISIEFYNTKFNWYAQI